LRRWPEWSPAHGAVTGQPGAVGCALAKAPGVSLGVAAGLLTGKTPGVHASETLLSPAEYFEALARAASVTQAPRR
jgi:hypothetical protein